MTILNLNKTLYKELENEAKFRNLTIPEYIKFLSKSLQAIHNIAEETEIFGTDLRDYYLECKNSFRYYLEMMRGIDYSTIQLYLSTLDRKLHHVYQIEDLEKNLALEYTNNYGRALKDLFNFMEEHEGMLTFNMTPIERWKKHIKLIKSNSDSGNSFLSMTKIDEI